jgi:hypothetical protein
MIQRWTGVLAVISFISDAPLVSLKIIAVIGDIA